MKFLVLAAMVCSLNVYAQNFGLNCKGTNNGKIVKIEVASPYIGTVYEDQSQVFLSIETNGENPIYFLDDQINFVNGEINEIGLKAHSRVGTFEINTVVSPDGFGSEGKASLELKSPFNIYTSNFSRIDVSCEL